jgi:hypothetical protein
VAISSKRYYNRAHKYFEKFQLHYLYQMVDSTSPGAARMTRLAEIAITYKLFLAGLTAFLAKWAFDVHRQNSSEVPVNRLNVNSSIAGHRALHLIWRHAGTVLTDKAQVEFTERLRIIQVSYIFGTVGYFTSDPRDVRAITETHFNAEHAGC